MDNKIAHLGMIQAVIIRMAANSALLKGWTVAILAAVFALAAKDAETRFVIVAYVPCAMFWVLDAFYLRQERLFRTLYDHVRQLDEKAIDFSMSTQTYSENAFSAFFATVNLLFYGPLLAIVAFAMYWLPKVKA